MEVEAEDNVRLGNGSGGTTLAVGLEDYHVADARHPIEIVGVFVRHNARHRMSQTAQSLAPRNRRAYGIAIGIGVR